MPSSSKKPGSSTSLAGSPESVKLFGRNGLPDIELWPQVDEFAMSEPDRLKFVVRKSAVEMYAAGAKISTILSATGLVRSELYRYLDRALEMHPDGKIWGMRALKPWQRIDVVFNHCEEHTHSKKWSGPGAFKALLERHPSLDRFIRDKVLKRAAAGKVQESRIAVKRLHSAFLQECRKLGLNTNEDYPFSTTMGGYVTLAAYVHTILAESKSRMIQIQYGDDQLKKMRVGDGSRRPIKYPYERVECDAHRIDAMFCILIPTTQGDILPVIVGRLWVLAIIEIVSRTVLGYYLSLNKECDESDLLKCIQRALSPWSPRDLSGTSLTYKAEGGFPSKLGSQFIGICWDEFSVDGAKINRSQRVESKLRDIVGAKVTVLPRASPDDRPFVERFFGTLEEGGFHRLPNTTGNGPDDIRRDHPEINACKYFIQLEDLENVLDVLIANYNGQVHSNLNGRTPLEHLAWSQHRFRDVCTLRYANAMAVQRINSMHARVRVSGGEGRRPFIHFSNATYSCAAFSHAYELKGQYLTIEADPDDARVVFAYMPNGDELGPLSAAPPWDREPHSFWMRKQIIARIRTLRWNAENFSDPIMSLLDDLEQRVLLKKEATSDYLQLRRYIVEKATEFREIVADGPIDRPIQLAPSPIHPSKRPPSIETMPPPKRARQGHSR